MRAILEQKIGGNLRLENRAPQIKFNATARKVILIIKFYAKLKN